MVSEHVSPPTFTYFKLSCFFLFSSKSSLNGLNIKVFSDIWFADTFSPFYRLCFHFLDDNPLKHKILKFDKVKFIFSFVVCTFGVISKKPLTNSDSQRFLPMFSSKSFVVLAPTIRCLTHLELTLVYAVK